VQSLVCTKEHKQYISNHLEYHIGQTDVLTEWLDHPEDDVSNAAISVAGISGVINSCTKDEAANRHWLATQRLARLMLHPNTHRAIHSAFVNQKASLSASIVGWSDVVAGFQKGLLNSKDEGIDEGLLAVLEFKVLLRRSVMFLFIWQVNLLIAVIVSVQNKHHVSSELNDKLIRLSNHPAVAADSALMFGRIQLQWHLVSETQITHQRCEL
jgi:hypothetical protein